MCEYNALGNLISTLAPVTNINTCTSQSKGEGVIEMQARARGSEGAWGHKLEKALAETTDTCTSAGTVELNMTSRLQEKVCLHKLRL